MPVGGTLPITLIRNRPSTTTFSMAPGPPRMPREMRAPSKAGPAAVEAAESRPSALRTISPLVPMSTNSAGPAASASPVASSPATVSPPTNPPITGMT